MNKRIEQFRTEISELRSAGLYRQTRAIESPQEPRVRRGGKEYILLSSNNYLGLANHPDVKEAAIRAIREYGTGSGGSRLISGTTDLHEKLEERIAGFKKAEKALVFSSGYLANIGTIASVVKNGDLILSDSLNHASIIDGCRMSRADVVVYPHRDVDFLEDSLKKAGQDYSNKTKLIVTDGVFSMDGDIAPLPELTEIARKYDCLLMVDDAHATGVLGDRYGGTADHFGLTGEIEIQMGTMSKALGSLGGYVAGNSELIEFLINKARTFIYTTSLPAPAIAASMAAIEIIKKEKPAEKLRENVAIYKKGLSELGFEVKSETQIIPIMIGDAKKTMDITDELENRGILAQGIRPPSVPPGTSRIRTALMATHAKKDIEEVLAAFSMISTCGGTRITQMTRMNADTEML